MLAVALAAWALSACESSLKPSVLIGEARVTSVEVSLLESFPVQARALVTGELGDGCTTLDDIETSRIGNEFRIRITTARPAEAFCTQILVQFEETVELDVLGLDAGEYRVVANGVATTFRLDADNRFP